MEPASTECRLGSVNPSADENAGFAMAAVGCRLAGMKQAGRISTVLYVVGAIAVTLSACNKPLDAPTERGACWALARFPDGKVKFNKLAANQPDLEHCAAQLEIMRLRFRALGSTQTEVTGAYQGQFLFIQPEGVFTAQSYDGYRFPFLVRTGDGRLAMPGAMPQQ